MPFFQHGNYRNPSYSARVHKTNTPQTQSLAEKGLQMKAVKDTKDRFWGILAGMAQREKGSRMFACCKEGS